MIFGVQQIGKKFFVNGLKNSEKIETDFLNTLRSNKFNIPITPIAKLFRAVKLAENAGFGFDKMIYGWQSYYKSTPEIDSDTTSTTITFWFAKKMSDTYSDDLVPSRNQVGTKSK